MKTRLSAVAFALTTLLALAGCKPQRSETAVALTGPDAVLGVWVPDAAPRELLTADGERPPLNEEAARIYDERRSRRDGSYDPTSWCAGPGMPRILTMPSAFEIRRDGDRVAFLHDWYRWFRVVDLTPGAVEPPLPLTLGFPVGRWEGDTLVIDTVGLIDSTVMDASGMPHSEALKLIERLRVLPDGRLENRITIEDPETFTAPWETVLTFHRDAAARVGDDVCPDRLARGEPAEREAVPSPVSPDAARPPAPARTTGTARPTATPTPRLSGLWEPRTFGILVPDAPLSEAGLAVVDRNAAAMRSGRIMHTAWTSCRPGAVSTMTMPREKIVILESPDEITLLFEMPRMVRRLRLGGTHPEKLAASYVGDSVAHWEGGTLVVDTVGFNGHAELDARGQPTSERLHTVERFTPSADGSGIDIETTVTDPEYYSRPFVIKRAWKKSDARHPFEYDCMENPRKEDFENAYYVREAYRPVCMRVEGEGMTPSSMVCEKPFSRGAP